MRRSAVVLFLVALSIAWGLTRCGPAPASPAAQAPTVASPGSTTQFASPRPSATRTLPPSPSPTATPAPTSTPTASPQPTHSPVPDTPTPTAPPVLAPVAGDPLPMSLDWRLDANGHLTSGLIMEAGGQSLFLLSSLGRTVYALTEEGQVAWRLRTNGPVYALSLVDGTQVAAGDDAGNVTAFDINGRQLWQYALSSRVTTLRGNWQGGLLAGGWDEQLSFLDSGGELHWQAGLDGPVSGITTLPGLALAATLNGTVAAIDTTGAEVWRFRASAPVTGIGTAGDGADTVVVLALQDGQLLALSPDGAQRWRQSLGPGGPGGPGGPVWQPADLVGDAGYGIAAGTGGEKPVLALLSANGDMIWRRALPSAAGALASVDLDGDGAQEILVGLASGEVQAYDGQGRLRGSVHAGLQVWGLHAAGDGTALIRADVAAWRLGGEVSPPCCSSTSWPLRVTSASTPWWRSPSPPTSRCSACSPEPASRRDECSPTA